jgi:hypothetical protein
MVELLKNSNTDGDSSSDDEILYFNKGRFKYEKGKRRTMNLHSSDSDGGSGAQKITLVC